jgi:hypothetical protein
MAMRIVSQVTVQVAAVISPKAVPTPTRLVDAGAGQISQARSVSATSTGPS